MARNEPDVDQVSFEGPASPYVLALWNLIIRPPRRRYSTSRLGPTDFRLWGCRVKRFDITVRNPSGLALKCSHWVPDTGESERDAEPRPVVIHLHQSASCRLEALPLVPMFLPLGISLFAFDFAGCGESEGEYVSLGWFERDDLAACIDFLRTTAKVSAVGLWGRSMGAVTALLHADRDPSIGGMVLDSPFCNLRQLVGELAQSDYLSFKVPTWMLAVAIAFVRLRIMSLCGFDIDKLSPENHVGASFIPALFIGAHNDDFIAPHHTQKLYEAYTGDKELEMVDGDHDSARSFATNQKALLFFCRAFRCDPGARPVDDGFSRISGYGFVAKARDGHTEVLNRRCQQDVCRKIISEGSNTVCERQRLAAPFRIDGAVQLEDGSAQAGFGICLMPLPSDYGGFSRPPTVLFAYLTLGALRVERATGSSWEVLAQTSAQLDLGAPVLCVLEVRDSPCRIMLRLGSGEPVLQLSLVEEHDEEVCIWPVVRGGAATFFECAAAPLDDDEEEEEEEEAKAEQPPEAAAPRRSTSTRWSSADSEGTWPAVRLCPVQ